MESIISRVYARLARMVCNAPVGRAWAVGLLTAHHPQRLMQALAARPDLTKLLQQAPPEVQHHWFRSGCEALRDAAMPQELLDSFITASELEPNYSQEGEELVLRRLMQHEGTGYYVEVGAYRPRRFSNTYALYRQGWRGLNIDATPGSMDAFRRLRPEDCNVEHAVSDSAIPLLFHQFREPALNTFDTPLAESYVASGWEKLGQCEIVPRPLRDILAEHWPQGRPIHLMSIDVEGEEMGVLRSNDWHVYSPHWLVIEVLDTPLDQLAAHPVIAFLRDVGFTPVSKLGQSVILKRAI